MTAGTEASGQVLEASPRHYENILLSILFVTFGFVFFDRLALAFLFPYVARDLHLDASHLGLLAAGLALTWAISGWAIGALSDRTGSRKGLLITAVVAFSLMSFLSGTATSFGQLLAYRLLMGVAEGPVLPLCQSLLAAASSRNRRGLNMGLLQASASGLLGAMLAPPILNWIAQAHGWRSAFYLSCIPGLILAILIAIVVREPRVGRSGHISASDVTAPTPLHDPVPGNIRVCLAISCCFVTWFMLINVFGPSYLLTARGFTVEAQSAVLMVSGLAYVVWGFAVPAISDRFGRRLPFVGFAALCTLTPLAMMYVESPFWMAFVIALTYFGPGCLVLFMATIPAESVDPRRVATTLGLVMGTGEVVGGCVMPYLAGLASVRYGPHLPLLIASAGAACSAALALLLRETAPSQAAKTTARSPA